MGNCVWQPDKHGEMYSVKLDNHSSPKDSKP